MLDGRGANRVPVTLGRFRQRQAVLREQKHRRSGHDGLLQGLVRCKGVAPRCGGSRVAAGELEQFIFERIRALGRDRAVLKATIAASPSRTDPEELRAALRELDAIWAELFPAERARVLALLIEEIRFHAPTGDVQIQFREGAPNAITKP